MVDRRSFAALFFAVFIFAPVMWMALDRQTPFDFENVTINPSAVYPGENIYITFTVKQNRPICGPGLVYREFKEASGKLHIYDPILRASSPILLEKQFVRIATLPSTIGPGPTTYRGISCFSCNPLQSWLRWPVCVTTPDIQFTVLPTKEVNPMK